MNITRLEEDDFKIQVFKKLGINRTDKTKVVYKMEDDTLKNWPDDIDYWKSEHTLQIQRSKYLQIEHKLDALANKLKRPAEMKELR